MAITAFLGGVTGFGAALVSTPILLSLGFPLDFVVTINLTLLIVTRISVSYRLRKDVQFGIASTLILSSVPGLYLGAKILVLVEASVIKFAAGLIVMISALILMRQGDTLGASKIPGTTLLAGFAGGFLGSTTSLIGVPPAIALAHEKTLPARFLGTLAAYFVVSGSIALVILAAQGALVSTALFPTAVLWLPGVLLGNFLGVSFGSRLSMLVFARLTACVIFVAGSVTLITSQLN